MAHLRSHAAPKARIFLSYKRNLQPDEGLALEVFRVLSGLGYNVFIDQTLRVGQEWARQIEHEVRRSDFLIVFLTSASSQSEMVRGEIEIALDEARKTSRPRLLPVRVAFTEGLPYPLNAYLDKVQYAPWTNTHDTPHVIEELLDAIDGRSLPQAISIADPTRLAKEAPLYSANLPPPGGTLDLDDPWYIPRSSDTRALSLIRSLGRTISIKGPRQMGKSSLLVRTVAAGISVGKQAVLLDFQLLGQGTLLNSNAFFRRFIGAINDQLEIPSKVDQYWADGASDPQTSTRYMEREILRKLDYGLVLAIDEADVTFGSQYRNDFFGMLRAWHNSRGNPLQKGWRNLGLVLVTSTEPYLFIDRDSESPFNVGETIALEDFDLSQVHELNRRHGFPLSSNDTETLVDLLGGHPYLTRKALFVVTRGEARLTPQDLFDSCADDSGPFGDHLRNYLLRLHGRPDLVKALDQIIIGSGCDDHMVCYRLQSAGLVQRENGKIVPRCRLYAEYFRTRLH